MYSYMYFVTYSLYFVLQPVASLSMLVKVYTREWKDEAHIISWNIRVLKYKNTKITSAPSEQLTPILENTQTPYLFIKKINTLSILYPFHLVYFLTCSLAFSWLAAAPASHCVSRVRSFLKCIFSASSNLTLSHFKLLLQDCQQLMNTISIFFLHRL